MASNTEKRTVQIVMDGKQPSNTLKGLSADIKTLNKSIRDLPSGSKEFEVQAKKLRELQKEYQGLQKQVSFAGQSLQYFKSQLKAVAIGTIGGNVITAVGQAISAQVSQSIQYMADLSDELANIRKTTGLSAEGVDKLNRSLSQIDSRTSKKALREIAVGLGQIGEEANIDNIRAIDTVVVALGDEFGGSAQEITTAISILRNNLTDFKTGNYADDILKIGNALNVLGATGLATAPVVTDFATRMSGVLEGFGVKTGQVLGLSAAMQELGISVERGSTAVTKLVQKMSQNPEVFAKVAGAKTKKEVEDFIKLLNTDAVAALLKVAKGAKSAGNSNTQFASILKDLESTGAGVGEVLSKFAANSDLVTKRVNTSNEALTNANSINSEFALVNENSAAKIEKLKKSFAGLIDNTSFQKFFTGSINITISFVKWLKEIPQWLQRNAYWIKGLGAAYATYYIAIGSVIVAENIKLLLSKKAAAQEAIILFLRKASTIALQLHTNQITIAEVRQRILNKTTLANPYVLFASVVAGATLAIVSYVKAQKEAISQAKILSNTKLTDFRVKSSNNQADGTIAESNRNIKSGELKDLKAEAERLNGVISRGKQQLAKYKKEVDETLQNKNQNKIDYKNDFSSNLQKIEKTDLQKKEDAAAYADAVRANNAQVESINKVAGQRQKVRDLILESNKKIADSDKELTEKQKKTQEEAHRILLEKQTKYNEELAKILNDVEHAKIEAIEEENARELLQLDFDKSTKEKQINQEIDAQKELAKVLGKGSSVLAKIEEDRGFLLLGIREKYERDRKLLIEKQAKETNETAYKKELDALTQKFDVEKLLEKQLYAEGKSSKEKYDAQIQDLDRHSKVELLALAKKYGKSENEIQQAIADIDIKIAEDKTERLKRAMLNEAEVRLRLANLDVNGNKTNKFGAIKEQYDAETNLLTIKLATEAGITELNEQNIFNIKKQFGDQFAELDQQYAQERQSQIQSIIDGSVNAFTGLFDAITSGISQQIQAEMDMLEKQKEAELNSLEDKKNKKLIYEDEYAQKKDEITKKSAAKERELKRKQAVMDKTAAIFQISLNTAQAIMSALTAPWPASIAFAALAGAIGAVQLGFAIAKPIPYGKGGKFMGTVTDGPSHDEGGMPVINPKNGDVVAELEGGEPILSKKTYANNKQVVDSLLYASQYNNGAKIKTPNYFKGAPTFAYGGVIGAYQSTTLARAGFVNNSTNTTTTTVVNNSDELMQLIKMQTAFIEKNIKRLDEPAYGVWDFDYYTKSKENIERAKKTGSIG